MLRTAAASIIEKAEPPDLVLWPPRRGSGTWTPRTLGEKLRALRQAKGFTLEQLADLTGSSKSYIWELENRSPPRPSAEKLSKVAEQLDTTIEYLLDEDDAVAPDDAMDASFCRK